MVELKRLLGPLMEYVAANRARQAQSSAMNVFTPPTIDMQDAQPEQSESPESQGATDEVERGVTLHVTSIRLSEAQKVQDAIEHLPGVSAVQMDYDRVMGQKAKFCIRTSLTTPGLAGIILVGIRGMRLLAGFSEAQEDRGIEAPVASREEPALLSSKRGG